MRLYTKITDEPVQEIPSHDSSHGSPPSDFQPFNCGGLFRALYIDRSTWTAEHMYNNYKWVHLASSQILLLKLKGTEKGKAESYYWYASFDHQKIYLTKECDS